MKKDELIKKLAGSSFKEYLKACDHLTDFVKSGEVLNQEIIERALFVNLLPMWAKHKDLFEKYEAITKELPNHSALLNNEKTKEDLMGLSIFINGLINGVFDVSGFFWCNDGYMCCSTACESISKYYKKEGKKEESAYFRGLQKWFMQIYSGTTDVFRAIMEIKTWNEDMIIGLNNFLTESLKHYGIFEWILSGLYSVVGDPLIQEKVFDHYTAVLVKSRAALKKEKKLKEADDITEKLKNLKKLAQGKTV
jgi:hypothetical protein